MPVVTALPGRVASEKLLSSLGYFYKRKWNFSVSPGMVLLWIWFSLGPSVGRCGCWRSEVFSSAWQDVSCLVQMCLACARRWWIIFQSDNYKQVAKKGKKIEIENILTCLFVCFFSCLVIHVKPYFVSLQAPFIRFVANVGNHWSFLSFFVFLLIRSSSVNSIPTAPLLFAVLHLPKGRLKHLNLCTLLVSSVFGWLFFLRLSLLLMLGQEKQGSNYSIWLLCNISWILLQS